MIGSPVLCYNNRRVALKGPIWRRDSQIDSIEI
jgi:hypothetical protein